MAGSITCTLKTEQPGQEVIQERRIVCENIRERTHRISAAQRQPANTRSKRAQEMGRWLASKAKSEMCYLHFEPL